MLRLLARITLFLVLLVLVSALGMTTVSADTPAGEAGTGLGLHASSGESLSRIVHEFGRISLSLDAMGSLETSGVIQVDKPNGGKVRRAYLMSATTGFQGARLDAGDVTLQGNAVVWSREITSTIDSYNYWADVTAIVKPVIDAAPAGLVDLQLAEADTLAVDGEILAVIFDDPNQTTNNTVLLYFGSQDVAGDSFTIDLGAPIDKDDPNLILTYSLGISYGYQVSGSQYSIVDVNGTRLTTSAGGEDDGASANGALITVGGIGDSVDNPADPNATPQNALSDDELYDLLPFVQDGDSSIVIDTQNPSMDDNILFAALFLGTTRGVGTTDVDITLYNSPTTSEERASYENVINYFADGVYEASNGAHRIGRVTFHPSGTHANLSDVVWVEKCHPSASPGGIAVEGQHVNMCDVFEKGGLLNSDYDFLSNDAHQRMGGYALAHEWGHYYYTVYDEYVGRKENNDIFHFPHSTDKAVKNSIMNSTWNARGLFGDDFKWLNFSTAKNDTGKTAQHRVYGASAWDTLTRPPADDPRDGERVSLPERVYYSELVDVKPAEKEDPRIDLPGSARSALKVVWQDAPNNASLATALTDMPYAAQLASLLGHNISYPDPIVLLAFVHRDAMITGANVQGTVRLPDDTIVALAFADDGVPPDAVAADGLYSAILGYEEDGVYTIQVAFSNEAGTAQYVYTSFAPAIGEDGPLPVPSPIPVGEEFSVSDAIQVSVSNVAPDDHGDTPAEATELTANNESVAGRIDRGGDRDVFQVTTASSGMTYARVTNLALGMDPQVQVLGPDGTTVLHDASLSTTLGDYVYIPLGNVPPSTTVYVEVRDVSTLASGGLYEVSVGRALASDVPRGSIRLPIVTR